MGGGSGASSVSNNTTVSNALQNLANQNSPSPTPSVSGGGSGVPPSGGAGKGNPSGPGSQGPGNPGGGNNQGGQSPGGKPTPPNPNAVTNPFAAAFPALANVMSGPAGTVITAAALAVPLLQAGVSAVDRGGKGAQDLLNTSFGKDPLPFAKSASKVAQTLIDPLGVNIPLQMAVSGFETLLSLTGEIRDYAKKDLGFSPEALSADVEGSIVKLLSDIEIAQRTDPLKAEFIRVWTDVMVLFSEFQAQLFEVFAPAVIDLLKSLVVILKTTEASGSFIGGLIESALGMFPGFPFFKIIIDLLSQIHDNTKKEEKIPAGLSQEILDFMNPNLQVRNMRQAFPNFVW
jgi:hypothetical protein